MKRLPFGGQQQCIAAGSGLVRVLAEAQPFLAPQGPLRRSHGLRVECLDPGAALQQRARNGQRRRFSHVVGVGLERQPPQRETQSLQILPEAGADLARQRLLLVAVDRFDGLQDARLATTIRRRPAQRLEVFGQAGTAVTAAWIKEVVTDPGIRADTLAHLLDIGAQRLRHSGHLVDERDPGRQHGIGGILGQFRGTRVHAQQAPTVTVERRIQSLQNLQSSRVVVNTDDNALRPHEILHGRSLLEKLRVGDHREVHAPAAPSQFFGHGLAYVPHGAYRGSGLVGHQPGRVHVAGDGAGDLQDMAHIGASVPVRRRGHREEQHIAMAHRRLQVVAKLQPAGGDIGAHQRFQARFVNGQTAVAQQAHLVTVLVQAQDAVPRVRKAGAAHQPHVPGAENRDVHTCSLKNGVSRTAPRKRCGTPCPTPCWGNRLYLLFLAAIAHGFDARKTCVTRERRKALATAGAPSPRIALSDCESIDPATGSLDPLTISRETPDFRVAG